ncbi:MAG: hypothetical protein DMG33_01135 [Acidobacteria bacterium]|nr:MAG: hypothetical protein DMG33_01135 [Acidobacteriota bacterium]
MKTKDGFLGKEQGQTQRSRRSQRARKRREAERARKEAGGIGRGRWRGIMQEDSTKKLLCQTITLAY